MTEDRVVKLKAIDSTILIDVVRQDQRSPLFEVTEWSVRRLSDKGIINPDGLWLFRCTPNFRPYALQFFGLAEEDLYMQWLPMLSYSLDCADEARILMKQLPL